MKLTPYQAGRAGQLLVAAEIHLRGANAVELPAPALMIDIMAWDNYDKRRISIQVKTKQSGTWWGKWPADAEYDSDDDSFWIFVDIGMPYRIRYFVVPREWISDCIKREHGGYLKRYISEHGHDRENKQVGIPVKWISEWADRWDILGIWP